MSFASASAARQQKNDDKDDGRPRLDRFRSHTSREGETDRFKSRLAQNGDDEEPRRKTLNDRDKDDTRRLQTRSKFEQPWFRDGVKASPAENDAPERSWRDRERKPEYDRPQPDPQWMSDKPAETGGHTQEDFAKWKASMKPEEKKEEVKSPALDLPFTPLWDTKKLSEPATPKPIAGAKSSRFAGFFAPPPPQPEPVQEIKPPAKEDPKRLSSTTEDQEGFQRMMAMLRMGNGSNGGQPLFAPPQPEAKKEERGPASPNTMTRDSQFLLKLMQQPRQEPPPFREERPFKNEAPPIDNLFDHNSRFTNTSGNRPYEQAPWASGGMEDHLPRNMPPPPGFAARNGPPGLVPFSNSDHPLLHNQPQSFPHPPNQPPNFFNPSQNQPHFSQNHPSQMQGPPPGFHMNQHGQGHIPGQGLGGQGPGQRRPMHAPPGFDVYGAPPMQGVVGLPPGYGYMDRR